MSVDRTIVANEHQTQINEPPVCEIPIVEAAETQGTGSVLKLRFSGSSKDLLQGELSWESASPEVWLVSDLLRASGAVLQPVTNGVFAAEFSNREDAILCSRRIQWALRGLTHHPARKDSSAAILIHLADLDTIPENLATSFASDKAQGRILVEDRFSTYMERLSGIIPNRSIEGFVREVNWEKTVAKLDPEFLNLSNPPSDQEILNRQLVSEERMYAVNDPILSNQAVHTPTEQRGAWIDLPRRAKLREILAKRNRIIVGSLGALAFVVLAVILASHAPKPNQTSPSRVVSAPPHQSKVEVQHDSPPVAPQQPAALKPSRTELRAGKQAKPQAQVSNPVPGSCDLGDAEIERDLERAKIQLHAGEYSQALRYYRLVAGCPLARERAQQGIDQGRQRMSLQARPESPQ
jgi:hypothetical protein